MTVVKCLTEHAISKIDNNSDYEFGIERILEEAYRKTRPNVTQSGRLEGKWTLWPLILSSMGVWHKDFLRELRKLSNYVVIREGKRVDESWKFLFAELSCALAKGNYRILSDARNKF